MRIYLDNCCFNRPFDNQSQIRIYIESHAKLFVQEKIWLDELELVWSYILDYENRFNPFEERQNVINHWKNKAISDISENEQVLKSAHQIINYGIKSKDALHIACAIEGRCEYFLTTDDIILKKLKDFVEITVINPVNFITLFEQK
jgi:predicted nucleic acid-binding protein